MIKSNVLIFPAGTEIAMEIRRSLKDSKFINLYGATSVPCHAEMLFEHCFSVPMVGDSGLVDALNRITSESKIDYIYPAHDDVLLYLTFHQEELKAKVVTSALSTVSICRSKKKTYHFFSDRDYIPITWLNVTDILDSEYPVFVKPAVGQGSQGAEKIEDRKHLYEKVSDGREYVICEYLPGEEFTVDCFTDKDGVLRYIGQRTRERIRSGIAVRSRFATTDPEVELIANEINDRMSFTGAWFFQLKRDRYGKLKMLEIAPRIAGTMGLSRNVGINLPLLTLYVMWGMDVDLLKNDGDILLDRAFISRFQTDIEYDSVYVDYDDTLVKNGNVNPFLIAFLYQCQNKGKRIVLLTKRNGPVDEGYVDRNMFSSVIHISRSEEKADYIRGRAIFIDDSFSERKKVHDRCGIPVFDLDAVESLFDWRA